MARIKVLWIGDAVATTGFASVSHNVLSNLPKRSFEVHQLGVNYFGDPHEYNYKIYPAYYAGGEVYGIKRLAEMVNVIQPDVIAILNDAWIIDFYLEELKKRNLTNIPIVTYFPIDAVEHSPKYYRNFDIVKRVCVYTNFAKDVLVEANAPTINPDNILVIPHGTDTESFYPVSKEEARMRVFPPHKMGEFMRSFIVLNGNRNQPRKRIDITMWAFREFQRDKPDVKLYLHMGITDSGVNIVELAHRYGFSEKFVITANTANVPSVSKERLNYIYNGCDVGLNTSMGEGWGLVNWEHAATAKAQIVPRSSAPAEIWPPGSALFAETTLPQMFPNINTVGRVVDIDSVIKQLNFAYDSWKSGDKKLDKIANTGYNLVTDEKYSWKAISKQFAKVFRSVL